MEGLSRQFEFKPGISIHYEIHGRGPLSLCCIHGFGGSLETWRDVQPLLSRSHELILVDCKGSGRSSKPADGAYDLLDHARPIAALLGHLDRRRVVLIGNSFGGAIAVAVESLLRPESRIRAVVLIGAAGYPQRLPPPIAVLGLPFLGAVASLAVPPRLGVKVTLLRAFCDPRLVTRDRIDRYAPYLKLPGGRQAARATAITMRHPNWEEMRQRIRSIRVPALIVAGDHDIIVPTANAHLFHADIPGSELQILAGCGHIPQEEMPEKTAQLIEDFLRRRVDDRGH